MRVNIYFTFFSTSVRNIRIPIYVRRVTIEMHTKTYMAPCDFWLFPQLKTVLKGNRFEDIDAIKKNATSTLNTIPKDSFKKCFQPWQDHWKQCVSSQREYFENY